jgi:DNA-binding HxlR family transcriptional regulator
MSRTYDQYCPVARALELVGERWTLLVARELLLGPRRFTDLMAGLPGISANVLAGRLKDLEEEGLVARRTLPPPAASAVYDLTPEAAGLVSVLAAMAEWGMTMLGEPRADEEVRGEWLVLGLAVTAPAPDVVDGTTYELHIDGEVLHVQVRDGNLQPHQGPADDPDAVLTMDATALGDVSSGRVDVDDALAAGRVTVEGHEDAARRLLTSFSGLPNRVT